MKRWEEGAFFTDEFIADNSWNGYEHDILCRNDDNGKRFTDIAHVTGIDLMSDGRGMTYLDYDLDGDLDVIVVNHRQPATFLRNDCGQKNNWLQVDLVGTKSNRQGVGARLTVRTGTKRQMREVRAGGGFLQSNSVPEGFGLGKATRVDELTIRWPSGIVQTVKEVPVNRMIRVVESGEVILSNLPSGKK
ncbi:ASPIC/UnbV domain-containing protein [Candidatus Poribacteria bacterium]|nr:ASPIC/UnbV domain-containing protein [Candidatus Poribacteria bacterium]